MRTLTNLLFALALLPACGLARAGMLYTDPAAFSAAVAGLSPSWSEDFETFAPGLRPLPVIVGGGDAQYTTVIYTSRSNVKNNLVSPTRGPGKFLAIESDDFSLQGTGGGPLQVRAISFEFGQEAQPVQWTFSSNLQSHDVVSSTQTNDGSPEYFLGWIGSSARGETLVGLRAVSTIGVSGKFVGMDDIHAYMAASPVPEPAPALLLLLGGSGLFLLQRRRPA